MADARLGNIEEAKLNFQKALSLDSTYLDTYSNFGSFYINLGELEKAKNTLFEGKKYLKNYKISKSSKSFYCSTFSIVLLKLDDCKKALKYSSKALEKSQDEKVARYRREIQEEIKNCIELQN